jgi:hypothetical protein
MQRAQHKIRNSGMHDGATIDTLTRICDGLSIDDIESFGNR